MAAACGQHRIMTVGQRWDSRYRLNRESDLIPDSSCGFGTMPTTLKVALIDDDESARTSLARLLRTTNIQVVTFSSAREFLENPERNQFDCAVSDVRMPELDGFDLQEALAKTLPYLSVVFITGHGDIPMTVRAMQSGAVDFLEKPVDDKVLIAAIRRSAERSRTRKTSYAELEELRSRYELLTPRERQVLALVTAGLLNKQVAQELGTGEKTIKVHRARVTEKMRADSLADLVAMAERLGVRPVDADFSKAKGKLPS
jgi:FixJ family two-component response regulator